MKDYQVQGLMWPKTDMLNNLDLLRYTFLSRHGVSFLETLNRPDAPPPLPHWHPGLSRPRRDYPLSTLPAYFVCTATPYVMFDVNLLWSSSSHGAVMA
jgi:hypothetical protein